LYAAHHTYSGAAWDEIMDPHCGVQHRLVRAIQPFLPRAAQRDTSWWESLVERHIPALEVWMHTMDTNLQEIQRMFSQLVKQIQLDLSSLPEASSVHVSLADKLEKLHVSIYKQTIQLERRAYTFQIADACGSVPVWNEAEWRKHMQLPIKSGAGSVPPSSFTTKKIKKRKVIDDDSDSTAEDKLGTATHATGVPPTHVKTKTIAPTGLRVSIQQAATVPNGSNNSSKEVTETSLNHIKQSMGVQSDALTSARELLEAEEAVTTRDAHTIDSAPVHNGDSDSYSCNDDEDIYERQEAALEKVELQVERLRKRLFRALQKEGHHHDEIWDLRECLRSELMRAGNISLWWKGLDDNDEYELLNQSKYFFGECLDLVDAQFELLKTMVDDHCIEAHEVSFFSRNLTLLKGQACLNKGICLLRSSQLPIRNVRGKHASLIKASRVMNKAVECADSIITRCNEEMLMGEPMKECILDSLGGFELKAMALRWSGSVLWHRKEYDESEQSFQEGASLWANFRLDDSNKNDLDVAEYDDDRLSKELRVGSESYYCWAVLADLAVSQLGHGGRTNQERFYTRAITAYTQAALLSQELYTYFSSFSGKERYEANLKDNDIAEAEIVELAKNDLQDWWDNAGDSAGKPSTLLESHDNSTRGNRSDVSSADAYDWRGPTAFVIAKEARRKKKQTKRSQRTNGAFSGDKGTKPQGDSVVYCKWGDQLFPQKLNNEGEWIPDLKYPSIAPEMPPDIAALTFTAMTP
jgi:hypothetical protein